MRVRQISWVQYVTHGLGTCGRGISSLASEFFIAIEIITVSASVLMGAIFLVNVSSYQLPKSDNHEIVVMDAHILMKLLCGTDSNFKMARIV